MSIVRGIAVLGAVLLVAGCVTAPAPSIPLERGQKISLTPEQKSIVETGVRNSLKDPNSAMFGEMVASRKENGIITVCGIVNAKNSFGGYVGKTNYIGLMPKWESGIHIFNVVKFGSSDSDAFAVQTLCDGYGAIQ